MAENAPANDDARPDFEQALAELEAIVHELEEGRLGLSAALARYERGVHLLQQCYQHLERAERRIELLCGVDAEGNPITQPFEHAQSVAEEEAGQPRSRRRTARGGTSRRTQADRPAPDAPSDIDEPQGLF